MKLALFVDINSYHTRLKRRLAGCCRDCRLSAARRGPGWRTRASCWRCTTRRGRRRAPSVQRLRGYCDFSQHLPFRSGEEGKAAEPRPRADDGGRLQDRDERRRPGHRGQAQHQVGQGEATLNCTEAGAHTQLWHRETRPSTSSAAHSASTGARTSASSSPGTTSRTRTPWRASRVWPTASGSSTPASSTRWLTTGAGSVCVLLTHVCLLDLDSEFPSQTPGH